MRRGQDFISDEALPEIESKTGGKWREIVFDRQQQAPS